MCVFYLCVHLCVHKEGEGKIEAGHDGTCSQRQLWEVETERTLDLLASLLSLIRKLQIPVRLCLEITV